MNDSVTIHGHRGSRGTHPENIIVSFEEAYRAGAAFIELDVHLSKDGHVVVFHDAEISDQLCRKADGSRLGAPVSLRSLTLEQIQTYQYGGVLLADFPEQVAVQGARISTLQEIIEWKLRSAPRLRLNVEIKRENRTPDGACVRSIPACEELAVAVLDLLRRYHLMDETLVQSFDHEVVSACRKIDPNLKLSCLFEAEDDFARIVTERRAQVAAVDFKLLNRENIAQCQSQGIEVLPWTVNRPEDWQRLIDLGVRSIITDYPRKLAAFLKI